MTATSPGTSPRPRSLTGTPTPYDELKYMLTQTASRSDREVGTMRLTQQVWRALNLDPRLPVSQRGRVMRELLHHLIEAHHALATNTAMCLTCKQKAGLESWQVLWLTFHYMRGVGFTRRLADDQFTALGDYVAKYGDQALLQAALAKVPPSLRQDIGPSSLEEIVAACPQKQAHGAKRASGYSERWYSDKRKEAIAALLSHLRAGDTLVQAFLSQQSEVRAAPSATRATPTLPRRQTHRRQRTASRSTLLTWRRTRAAPRRLGPGARLRAIGRHLEAHLKLRERWWVPALIALCVLVLASWSTSTPVGAAMTLGSADLSGYLIAQQYSAHEQRTLTLLDLRTGRWRPLWSGTDPASQAASTYGHPTAPAYAAASGQLAYIYQTSGQNSIWLTALSVDADGWPTAGETTPLLADCGGCSALSWSPSGHWLLYDSAGGLMAIAPTTGERRQITTTPHDSWPACSPDGRWLAYQRASNAIADIAILPTVDCLPTATTGRAPAYLEGYRPSWHPAWSPDSRGLAFTSNILGVGHVYITTLSDLLPSPEAGGLTAATVVSPAGCGDPAWAPRAAGTDAAVIAACDAPTPTNHHGTLVLASERAPLAWRLRIDEGARMRITLCWVPAPLLGPATRAETTPEAPTPTATTPPLSLLTPARDQ